MITTITPNPAIDIAYFLDRLTVGEGHRVSRMLSVAGGKGINVAKVLRELGQDVLATGFLGGANGRTIQTELHQRGIRDEFIRISGETRRTITINETSNRRTTELREAGPRISAEEQEAFFRRIRDLTRTTELFVCSGSLPPGLDETFFDRLMDAVSGTAAASQNLERLSKELFSGASGFSGSADASGFSGASDSAHASGFSGASGASGAPDASGSAPLIKSASPLILDTSGDGLRHVVFESPRKPLAIKPNLDEMRDLFGAAVESTDPVNLLRRPELRPIPIIILSLGKAGCAAKIGNRCFTAMVPAIDAVNPVGSGDASLAGLLDGLARHAEPEEILRTSMACGVLNTLEEAIGHIDRSQLDEMKMQIAVKEVV